MAFRETLEYARRIVEADGVISIGETANLLRMVRPYVLKGEPGAIELETLLNRVRADGVVTSQESADIIAFLKRLSTTTLTLAEHVREIPDFPKPGILFRDVTGLLDTADGFTQTMDAMVEALADTAFDVVAAPESRGFIFGSALSARFNKAFVPIRKPGKLPRQTVSETFDLEYGQATLHIHADAIVPGERVVIVDDLLATGGTARASAHLVEKLGGRVVKMIFPIELEGFNARQNALREYNVSSLIRYPGK